MLKNHRSVSSKITTHTHSLPLLLVAMNSYYWKREEEEERYMMESKGKIVERAKKEGFLWMRKQEERMRWENVPCFELLIEKYAKLEEKKTIQG